MMCDGKKLLNYIPLNGVTGEDPSAMPEQETERSLPTHKGNN